MSRDVHAALARALEDLRTAEKSAVLLFAEVMVNELYRDLGFASMEHYSGEKLGFSAGKTKQFMRLASRLEELPELKRAVVKLNEGFSEGVPQHSMEYSEA